MSPDEYDGLMDEAQRLLPKLRSFIGRCNDQYSLRERWLESLSPVPMVDARKTLDAMAADIKLQPYNNEWDRFHERFVRAWKQVCSGANQAPPPNWKCICNGSGLVEVTDKFEGMTWVTADGNASQQLIRVVACLCPRGKWVNDCRRRQPPRPGMQPLVLTDFDPEVMEVVTTTKDRVIPASSARAQARQAQHSIDAAWDRMDGRSAGQGVGTDPNIDLGDF